MSIYLTKIDNNYKLFYYNSIDDKQRRKEEECNGVDNDEVT